VKVLIQPFLITFLAIIIAFLFIRNYTLRMNQRDKLDALQEEYDEKYDEF